MHNIKTNFGRFHRICKEFFEHEADDNGNLQFYPKAPLLADLEVIALSCMMEAMPDFTNLKVMEIVSLSYISLSETTGLSILNLYE
jgi:hypothetical protein